MINDLLISNHGLITTEDNVEHSFADSNNFSHNYIFFLQSYNYFLKMR